MIIRIAVAIAALAWIHGAERAAEDSARAVATLTEEAPRAALRLCIENQGLCEDAARHVVTGALGGRMAEAAKPGPTVTARLAQIDAPLPPRRPKSR